VYVSGDGTVANAAGAPPTSRRRRRVQDFASGDKVGYFGRGTVHRLTASGTVTAGDVVEGRRRRRRHPHAGHQRRPRLRRSPSPRPPTATPSRSWSSDMGTPTRPPPPPSAATSSRSAGSSRTRRWSRGACARCSSSATSPTLLLTGASGRQGGAVLYETGESIFSGDNPRAVLPGMEYPLTVQPRPAGVAGEDGQVGPGRPGHRRVRSSAS
jgi:hypothetical protein